MTYKKEHYEHCQRIADELDELASGFLYRCNECGETLNESDISDFDGCYGTCECCHEYASFEQVDFFSYFENDIYDIKYVLDSNREYFACCLMVACGGPNIYIDTYTGNVELYWWGETAKYPLASTTRDYIDEYVGELFAC